VVPFTPIEWHVQLKRVGTKPDWRQEERPGWTEEFEDDLGALRALQADV